MKPSSLALALLLCLSAQPVGALLAELGMGFENVVQGTVYLADIADF